MPIENWPLFCLIVTGIVLCPGPMNLLVLSNAINFGFKKSIATMIGGTSAYVLQMFIVAFCLEYLLSHTSHLLTIIKMIGAVYLIYLGYQRWREAFHHEQFATSEKKKLRSLSLLFTQGFMTAGSNPKSLIVFSAIFPQFIVAQKDLFPQFMTMATSFSIIQFSGVLLYAFLGLKLIQWITKNKKGSLVPKCIGGILMSLGVLLLFSVFFPV